MACELTLPAREERDRLLATEFSADPCPPQCPTHSVPRKTSKICTVCAVYTRWLFRMQKRFNGRGLRFALDDRTYGDYGDDPPPPPCPAGHGDPQKAALRCQPCRMIRNWRARQYERQIQAGIPRTVTDLTQVQQHIELLRSGGMTAPEIGDLAGCTSQTISRITRKTYNSRFLHADLARRILAIPVPERRFALTVNSIGVVRHTVDSIVVARRVQAACLAGHSLSAQARRLGYTVNTVYSWLRRPTVSLPAAEAVQDLYPVLIAHPGTDPAAIAYAESRGWLPARYFSPDNIDDPAYRPLRTLDSPCGVRRRLRALAWMRHGAEDVAAFIDEKAEDVRRWMVGFVDGTEGAHGKRPEYPVPAYARHLTDAAFEALSGRFGTDEVAGNRARELGWAPPLAWYDLDIDDHRARPLRDLPSRDSKSNYPLQSQVLQALRGMIPAADLIHQEKYAVVRMLHRIGWSDRRIGVWLRWSNTVDKAGDGVLHFRQRWDIHGGPREREAWPSPKSEIDFIVTPAAA